MKVFLSMKEAIALNSIGHTEILKDISFNENVVRKEITVKGISVEVDENFMMEHISNAKPFIQSCAGMAVVLSNAFKSYIKGANDIEKKYMPAPKINLQKTEVA